MSFSLDVDQTRGLNDLKKLDIIEYASDRIQKDYFVVMQIDKDEEIPAILLQLWKFRGGYDHSVINIMENDLGLNKRVPYFKPEINEGKITNIISYRGEKSDLTKKEQFILDVWPDSESPQPNSSHNIPFKVEVEFDSTKKEMIIPIWTPLQRLPYKRVKPGTIVETWSTQNISNIMRVKKLQN